MYFSGIYTLLKFSILCYFILLLIYISERSMALFLLHSCVSYSYWLLLHTAHAAQISILPSFFNIYYLGGISAFIGQFSEEADRKQRERERGGYDIQ